MSSYISRVFARPQPDHTNTPPVTTDDRETELNLDLDQVHPHPNQDPKTPTPTPASNLPSTLQTNIVPPKIPENPSEAQFQIMLSSILTQNSNLLAQNTEQARVIDRLSICLTEAEAGQKELREEMRGMFKSIMDVLGGLKSTGVGGAGTPTSNPAEGSSRAGLGMEIGGIVDGNGNGNRGLISQNQGDGLEGGGSAQRGYWNRDKGKQKEDTRGIDPNILKRTFAALDTPTDRGDRGSEVMDIGMEMDGWNDSQSDSRADMLDSRARSHGRSS